MSAAPSTRLDVHLERGGIVEFVGTAHITVRRQQTSTAFAYGDQYLRTRDAMSISPDLPLSSGSAITEGLPGAFSDSAPDRWGQNLIRKRIRAATSDAGGATTFVSDVDFLLGVSDTTRQGSLRFALAGQTEFLDASLEVPKLIQLPTLLNAADLVARGASLDDMAAVKALLDAGSGSLGGARPKASVVDDGQLLIAKFPHHHDEWDVMAWEKTALDLAEMCGFPTPSRRLVDVAGRQVLVLGRFDRDGDSRVPYISAMTLVRGRDGQEHDYLDVGEALADHGSNVAADLEQLWRRIAFSIVINNIDDHLRNHGFLHRRGGWTLSPIFDINPHPNPSTMRATTVNFRQSADPNDEKMNLLSVAPHFGLRPDAAAAAYERIAEVVRTKWRPAARANHVAEPELGRFAEVLDR